MIILLSLWLRLYINYSPMWVIFSIAAPFLGAWIPILIHYRGYDPRIPLACALITLLLSSYYATAFNEQINFERVVSSRFLSGVSLSLFLAPLFRLSSQIFPREKLHECLNFFHVARLLGSGVGMALLVILWHRRQVFYYERLGSRLTEFSPVTHHFLQKAQEMSLSGKQSIAQLSSYLERHATALALEDCFYLMSWILGVLLVVLLATFFFKPPELLDRKQYPKEPELILGGQVE
jgi:DHA2 family multidrug resistance protein